MYLTLHGNLKKIDRYESELNSLENIILENHNRIAFEFESKKNSNKPYLEIKFYEDFISDRNYAKKVIMKVNSMRLFEDSEINAIEVKLPERFDYESVYGTIGLIRQKAGDEKMVYDFQKKMSKEELSIAYSSLKILSNSFFQ